MSGPFKCNLVEQLTPIVEICIAHPAILHHPNMALIKKLIEHFGGKIPEEKDSDFVENIFETECKTKVPEAEPESKSEPESEESDLELDMAGVIEPDTEAPQKMGNLTLQPTEEEIAESQAKRSEAVSAFVEKDYEKAIQLYTEAIVLNPQASLLYAKRGQVFLLQNKPNACIRDCNRALELNPDSAAAHKFRGRANHLLGNWEEAAADLRLACKFDFDEQADEWLREVTPNARKIEEHKRKRERRAQEKVEHDKQEKLKKTKDTTKTEEELKNAFQAQSGVGPSTSDFFKFINNVDVLQACRDPEVRNAFFDISADFNNISKYVDNPKVLMLLQKCMGGMPGFPDTRRPEESATDPKPQDDVNLD